ncbi:MAG: DUF2125 domain-containing protein [Pseudomonadota bacterium]
MMRNLFVLLVVASLGWSSYWWLGSNAKDQAINAWMADRRADGWVADTSDIIVRGYPNRFDTTFRDLNIADPDSGWAWAAPWFQIFALSYKPNHIIAVWPPEQSLASPVERITVTSSDMRGSLRFAPSTALDLSEARIQLEEFALASSLKWSARLESGQLAIRRSPEDARWDNAYDISLRADQLTLPGPLRDVLDPAGLLPKTMETADIRLTPVYDAPWNRLTIEDRLPTLQILNIGNVSFTWGRMSMTVTGRLDADPNGQAEGQLNVIARNWRDMLELSVQSGWVSADLQGTLETTLALLARGTGQTDRLDVTLNFKNGSTRLGPIPIGEAPYLNQGQNL